MIQHLIIISRTTKDEFERDIQQNYSILFIGSWSMIMAITNEVSYFC